MSGDGGHGLRMAFAWTQSSVQSDNMNIAQTLLLHDDEIAGFDQSPLSTSRLTQRLNGPRSRCSKISVRHCASILAARSGSSLWTRVSQTSLSHEHQGGSECSAVSLATCLRGTHHRLDSQRMSGPCDRP